MALAPLTITRCTYGNHLGGCMRKLRKLGSALVLATLVASGVAVSSTRANAWDGGQISNSQICAALNAAEAAVSGWPDSALKSYILRLIEAAEARYGCE